MITLHVFGPYFGLPDGSPFVIKAMLLLKLAGIEFRTATGGLGKAPKGKLPFIEDDGVLVADTSFIRFHLEERHGIDFDRGLDAAQKATAWAAERLCEDHLYWAIIDLRWGVAENFAKGPAHFFDAAPAPARGLIRAMIRRRVLRTLHGHGLGRHSRAEIERLAGLDLQALAALIGDKPYLMGDRPCGADATVFGMLASLMTPHFESGIRDRAMGHPNLVAYRDRMMTDYFPTFATRPAP